MTAAGTEASRAAGTPPGMDVRLSSNEAPFGPAPAAIAAIRDAAPRAHRYPDDQSAALREALADHEGVDPDAVAVGTGSAGLLMDLVAHECAGAQSPAVLAWDHSFIVYRLAARNAGAAYVEVPDAGPPTAPGPAGWDRDVDALLAAVDERTRVVMVDNPGNPTGTHLTGAELSRLLDGLPDTVTVVVDEAYHHFAAGQRDYATVSELEADHPRLLTVRTFSKAHGLAGLRVGYLTGPAGLVGSLDDWRVRFNVTATAQRAALASLEDPDHLAHTVRRTREGRRRITGWLTDRGIPSAHGLGNFVTVQLDGPAAPVVDAYADRGVGVRPLGPYGLDRQLRVTVGTEDQVDALLDASETVLAGGG